MPSRESTRLKAARARERVSQFRTGSTAVQQSRHRIAILLIRLHFAQVRDVQYTVRTYFLLTYAVAAL